MFQSTRPRGARHQTGKNGSTRAGFNPRARVGRDWSKCAATCGCSLFQSTRPRGARPLSRLLLWRSVLMFQSTRPRGARHGIPRALGHTRCRFNPRARVGRDLTCNKNSPNHAGVSIHAPAWGATQQGFMPVHLAEVSIHAPAWGATSVRSSAIHRKRRFNPRARVGRDSLGVLAWRLPHVSIHAPAWGATPNPDHSEQETGCFNPRARVGRDGYGGQSVAPLLNVSIHAPAWGAT